jgi:translation elongation factor EF-1beta
MAKVAVIFKIYTKEGEFDNVVERLKSLNPQGTQTEDVGFGIKVIKALFTFDDSNESSSKIEEKIQALEGVSQVEVQEESLV